MNDEKWQQILPFVSFLVSPPMTSVEDNYISITVLGTLNDVKSQCLSSGPNFIRDFPFLDKEGWFDEVYWALVILHHFSKQDSKFLNTQQKKSGQRNIQQKEFSIYHNCKDWWFHSLWIWKNISLESWKLQRFFSCLSMILSMHRPVTPTCSYSKNLPQKPVSYLVTFSAFSSHQTYTISTTNKNKHITETRNKEMKRSSKFYVQILDRGLRFRPWDLTIKRLPPVSKVTEIYPAILVAVKRIINVGTRPWLVNRVRIIQHPIPIEDITRTKVFYHISSIFYRIPRSSFDRGNRRKSTVTSQVRDETSIGRRNGGEGRKVVRSTAKAGGHCWG